ncbi:MAG: hypothetical protein M1834_002590 [Cirrosporium novae-zelandiae]|nr:MAG: hypothetical protein M1834_002590 [Cirrosporium novae-zelandiae]
MAPDKAGRVIFIGNIPYGLTEEQIIHTFSSVGQVLNFRLVYDRETGKPKGFGFAEFSDADAAASAVRNLNDYEIMGRRLRVDYSHEGGDDDGPSGGYGGQQSQAQNGAVSQQLGGLPPLPPGTDLPPNLTCPDAISRTLSTLPAAQLLDILQQMKALVISDPAKANELLKQAPQLSYAIFQALLLMNLVDTSVLSSVVEQAAQPQAAPQIAPTTSIPPYQPPQSQPQYPHYPQFNTPHVPTPPMQAPAYPTPPMQQPPAAVPNQQELLKQVLQMTQQQIDALPPNERTQIMTLRQQLMAQGSY